ncbi:endo-1,4-beta-xylanase [Leptolyngbya sp. FACHB-261]|uniref:endo-1,4-beta-xylanase n=1 Tax=Leptolyngbya sp. FACHB-261 TaxID=2692806 RepID=UPI001687152C|nr:endo-1,4-beta-xylanase [Leptolyngbya sp. FACHB-261]MBD2102766.1 endo-1,4-beta-xylanase [Leptolyngbya sp. FACHB-261]
MTKHFANSRRQVLLGLQALAGLTTLTALGQFRLGWGTTMAQATRNLPKTRETSLGIRADAKGLLYGAAGRYRHLSSDAAYAAAFVQQCSILVPENELKWQALRPAPDQFDFQQADWLANFARAHDLKFRGHTLLWHIGMPKWFKTTVNRQNAEQFLREHITTVVSRYAGTMHSWDVVNEAINPGDGRADGLRNTAWLKFLGPDYIDLAFRLAAAADPQALLVYNDFGLDYDTAEEEARRVATLKLLERLKSQGTPIHALGIQAHLLFGGDATSFNVSKLRSFLKAVADLGLKILITELDVKDQQLPSDISERDDLVAKAYEDYLTTVLSEPAVSAVLTWGLSDCYTWLTSYRPRQDGAPARPLPLDAQLQRKPAWYAMAQAFDQAPQRPTPRI